MIRNIRNRRRANCSKRRAAGISRWWRNNALLPFHLRVVSGGRDVAAGAQRPPFQQAATLYLPGYGTAIEAAPAKRQYVLHQWHQLAIASARNHPSQRTDPNREWKNLSF